MSLHALEMIREKKAGLPSVNKSVIANDTQGILKNFREIKGRNFNRSVLYRQVKRDDYPQPSWIEQLFDFWVSASLRKPWRGELIISEVESWRGWRDQFEPAAIHSFVPGRFWKAFDDTDATFTKLRQAHISGDVIAERTALVQLKQQVDGMLRISNTATEFQGLRS